MSECLLIEENKNGLDYLQIIDKLKEVINSDKKNQVESFKYYIKQLYNKYNVRLSTEELRNLCLELDNKKCSNRINYLIKRSGLKLNQTAVRYSLPFCYSSFASQNIEIWDYKSDSETIYKDTVDNALIPAFFEESLTDEEKHLLFLESLSSEERLILSNEIKTNSNKKRRYKNNFSKKKQQFIEYLKNIDNEETRELKFIACTNKNNLRRAINCYGKVNKRKVREQEVIRAYKCNKDKVFNLVTIE